MHSDRKEAELNRYLKRSEAAEASAAARSQRAVLTGASPQSLGDVRELLGPAWTIEGEDPERYEQLLVRVAEAVGPIDFIDWLLVKDVVALTLDIQRSRRQSETVIRIGRLEALKQILNQVIEGADLSSRRSTELTELATRWLNGESRATKQVAKWLNTSGYSFADVDAHAMTVMGVELERIDLQVERRLSATSLVAIRSFAKSSGEERAGRNAFSGQPRTLLKRSSEKCLLATPNPWKPSVVAGADHNRETAYSQPRERV